MQSQVEVSLALSSCCVHEFLAWRIRKNYKAQVLPWKRGATGVSLACLLARPNSRRELVSPWGLSGHRWGEVLTGMRPGVRNSEGTWLGHNETSCGHGERSCCKHPTGHVPTMRRHDVLECRTPNTCDAQNAWHMSPCTHAWHVSACVQVCVQRATCTRRICGGASSLFEQKLIGLNLRSQESSYRQTSPLSPGES